ncbi:hypothetical protein GCM10010136_07970 [Limoniibacter endophyticus]|uniref:DUF1134 domain-containing protein n=2 Tax=Limoniibacter endophyticus TaxID=1565040 RepID=A0A8J3GGG9_9HYPH|nr:hypothetical protein GCM10010136_07970 [Limoniibacter endophyticus]
MNIQRFFQWALRPTLLAAFAMAILVQGAVGARANQYSSQEIVDAGHNFFGSTSGGLAQLVERVFQSYGMPNGYVLGEEGGGAFFVGATYGEGQLHTKNAGDYRVYWQGPSFGVDVGGQGSRVMMLVYNLNDVSALYHRYVGVSGAAYVIAGFGFNVLRYGDTLIVPIRTGVGARLGVNVNYLKLTQGPTWNPF